MKYIPNRHTRAVVTNRVNLFAVFIMVFSLGCGCTGQQRFDDSILWSVEHPVTGARSYVMGTIHELDTNYITLPLDRIAALIAETDFLCLEVKLSETRQQAAKFGKAMFLSDTAQHVMKALDEPYQTELLGLLQSGKLANALPWELALPRLKPQAISFFLLMGNQQRSPLFQEANFQPESHFEQYAEANGIRVMGFEKSGDQLSYMIRDDGTSFEDGIEQLKASIDYFSEDNAERIDIYANYRQQNLSLLPQEVYEDSIMVMRNRNMALKADSMMQDNTIFLMIGAAHLPFSSGVLQLLQDKGYQVRPIEVVIPLKESR